MIESATLKLTLWYLGIIMALSVVFSFALYRESNAQLTDSANRQRTAIERYMPPPGFDPQDDQIAQSLESQLSKQLNDARGKLLFRLATLDLVTLVLGAAASYVLARRTLRPIEDSLEAQGRFTADASHELRTPLTAMRTEIEVALREHEFSSADARELLASNLEEIAKLETLSAGLLRLARFENGLDASAVTAVPVRELFEAAADRHAADLAERKIDLKTEAGPETVSGDRDSLVELVVILLDNAIKYSPPEATVTLRARATNQSVQLAVIDTGAGIKASDIPHIFERFYRADRSRAREHIGGYGLGLSIAKRIVDVHRGSISVTSKPGHGTTFTVKLPTVYEPAKPPFLSFISELRR
jgi:two-component system, OmpR family, sensor histidine kinase CiaH